MSKIKKDGLIRSGTGLIYSCTHMATVGVKGLIEFDAPAGVAKSNNQVCNSFVASCSYELVRRVFVSQYCDERVTH